MGNILEKLNTMLLGPTYDDEEEIEYQEVEVMEDEEEEIKRGRKTSSNNSKVVNIHQSAKMEVVRTFPEVVSDAFLICDYIRDNKVCIINLEGVDVKEAQRIADFLGGVAYAFNGDIQRVSKSVFVVAPTTVEITGQLKEDLKESGVIFPWLSAGLK